MSIFGPQPGNFIDEHGVHRDSVGRRRTLLDVAADSIPHDASAVSALLARYKPSHLLTPAELDSKLAEQSFNERLADRRRRLHDSGIVRVLPRPAHDIDAIVHERLRERDALAIVKAWWAEGAPLRPWLFLSGTTGVGKTWAGAWVIADWGGRYVSTKELVRIHASLAAARGPVQVAASVDAWERLLKAGVLVLDELGREPIVEAREALHELVDQRAAKPTLVLSNLANAAIRTAFKTGQLDIRTASRLQQLVMRDRNGASCWDVTGDDMRESAPEARP